MAATSRVRTVDFATFIFFTPVFSEGLICSNSGKNERKCRSDPHLAVHYEVTTHRSRKVAADGETESNAFARLIEPSVELHERFEDVAQHLVRNTRAGVGNADQSCSILGCG